MLRLEDAKKLAGGSTGQGIPTEGEYAKANVFFMGLNLSGA